MRQRQVVLRLLLSLVLSPPWMMTLDYAYSMSYSIYVYGSSITTRKLFTEDCESKGLPVLVFPRLYHNYPPSHKCNSSIILRVTQLAHSVGNVLLVIYPAIFPTI